jgi:hypothetical protein
VIALRDPGWLCARLHPSSAGLGLVVLKAFLDASDPWGSARVAVVAGFVAPCARWELFDSKWGEMLADLKLSRWHTTDYRRRTKEYAKWPDDKFTYAKYKVLDILNSCFVIGVGCAVDVDVFEDWRVTAGHFVVPDPHYFYLDNVMSKLIRGFSEPIDEGITIYCDQDEPERENLGRAIAKWHTDRLRRLKYDHPVGPKRNREVDTHYGSSRTFKGIQAADVLANDTYKCMADFLRTKKLEKPEFISGMKAETCPVSVDLLYDKEIIDIVQRAKFRRDEV